MKRITKCLNELNATLKSLGQGKLTILIRNYNTTVKEFLLYPTVSYLNNDEYLDIFQNKYKSFVEENSHPTMEDDKTEVKYYAKVEEVLEKPANRIGGLNKYHIWTNKHVKSYLNSKKAYVWILRVYKLKEPVMAKRTMGIVYSNLLEEVDLEDIESVLSDSVFNEIKNRLN